MKKPISLLLSGALILSLCVGTVRASGIPTGLSEVCTQEEWEMLKLTNQARLAAGLTPYSTFSTLQSTAEVRKQELTALYSHSRPNGSECFTVLTEGGLGYDRAGENIAAGQTSPRTAVAAWLDSEGHRQNILDDKFTHIGTGYTNQACTVVSEAGPGKIQNGWVQLFLGSNCSFTAISVSQHAVSCPTGTSLDDLSLYVQATCSVHGPCYLPLLAGMCTGFDTNTAGSQTVTVAYAGQTAQLQVRVGGEMLDTSGADSWAANWLEKADSLGLLSERNRTGFTTNVTRLQFADLAVSLAESLASTPIVPVSDNTFTDTAEEVIRKAKAAEIASGYQVGDGFEFRPNNPITRQEICVMLAHVADYVNAQRTQPTQLDRTESIKGVFTDTDRVADWAVYPVALMTNNNVMGGKAAANGTALEPESYTTLQEAITLSVKLFDLF